MKQTCVNCHFFARNGRGANGIPSWQPFQEKHREKFRKGDFSWVYGYEAFGCYHGVWDEGLKPMPGSRKEVILETERMNFCFYWPYHPGMLFTAAVELQKREAEAKAAAKDRRLTIWGLWIAGIALAVNAILELWQQFF